jgi:hypothetical protein
MPDREYTKGLLVTRPFLLFVMNNADSFCMMFSSNCMISRPAASHQVAQPL